MSVPPSSSYPEAEGIPTPHRSPGRAAALSLLVIGAGQVYNRQLEKAVLLWIWAGIHLGVGVLLLVLGLLGSWVPRTFPRPPLGDMIADHGGGVFLFWLLAGMLLWGFGVRDALVSARRINAGEIVIRYPMQRQMVHILASQLLGNIPLVGLFFPPGVVAEAIDATHQRRGPDHGRLVREGGQALLEWAATRIAVWGLIGFAGVWLIWWLLRIVRLVP